MQCSAAGRKSGALASASATSPIELRRRGLVLLRAQAGKTGRDPLRALLHERVTDSADRALLCLVARVAELAEHAQHRAQLGVQALLARASISEVAQQALLARASVSQGGGRRNTRLVVSASSASFAVAGAPSSLAKLTAERLAEPGERRAVVGEYNSRVILVEMLSEYAGTGKVIRQISGPVACSSSSAG